MHRSTDGARNHKSIADHPPHACPTGERACADPVNNPIVASGSIARAKSRTLTAKASVRQKSGQFRVFDAARQVGEDRSLSANAKHVAVRLALHVNKHHDGCSFPAVATLAGETSLCERSVRNALRELERERWILTLRSPGYRSNRYRLTYGRASHAAPDPAPRPGTQTRHLAGRTVAARSQSARAPREVDALLGGARDLYFDRLEAHAACGSIP